MATYVIGSNARPVTKTEGETPEVLRAALQTAESVLTHAPENVREAARVLYAYVTSGPTTKVALKKGIVGDSRDPLRLAVLAALRGHEVTLR